MEVSIRLQKSESKSKGCYSYRIVAMPKKTPRQGRALEILGYYNAGRNPAVYDVKIDKMEKWIQNGATMTDTVRDLFKKDKARKQS